VTESRSFGGDASEEVRLDLQPNDPFSVYFSTTCPICLYRCPVFDTVSIILMFYMPKPTQSILFNHETDWFQSQ